MTVFVDLDGVICSEEKTFERALACPLPGAVDALQELRRQGVTVVLYTARSWAEQRMTTTWLDQHGLVYDGLLMGKPVADLWIDDRAIPFEGWDKTLFEIRQRQSGRQDTVVKFPCDEFFLRENRRAACELLHRIAGENPPDPILEVGPMLDGRQSPSSPLHRYPQYYVDARALFGVKGKRYLTLDIDPNTKPDICGDLTRLDELVEAESIGTVILLHVLEHTERLWDVPRQLHRVLRPGGMVYAQTPWNLRFHGPRPDCWRISDDGYRALFGEHFDIVTMERVETPQRDLMPICFNAVLQKRK